MCPYNTQQNKHNKKKSQHTQHSHKAVPCAQMLASTIQFSHTTPTTTNKPAKTTFISSMVVNEQHTRAARDTQQRANAPNNYSLTTTPTQPSAHMMQETHNNKNAATHINNQRLCEQKSQPRINHPQLWNDQH